MKNELREPKITEKYNLLRQSLTKAKPKIRLFSSAKVKEKEEILDENKREQLLSFNLQEIDQQYEALFVSQLSIVIE